MTDGYLLDTNIVGPYFSGHPHVLAKIQNLPGTDLLFVSAITLGEIAFGHELTNSTDHQKRADCERFVHNEFPKEQVKCVDRNTMIYYGQLKAELHRRFPPQNLNENHPERYFDRVTGSELGIDENDLWIAAQAIQFNLILVTNDEMKRILEVATMGLEIQDWTEP